AAETALRLAEFTGDDGERARAEATLRALALPLQTAPTGMPRLLAVLERLLDRPREIVIVRPAENPNPLPQPFPATVPAASLPTRVLTVATEGEALDAQQDLLPFVAGKQALGGRPTAYVCERGTCELPTSDPRVLARQLAEVRPLPQEGTTRD